MASDRWEYLSQGAVEWFICGSGSRVEVGKCRAVLGTAFAGARSKPGGRSDDGSGCAGRHRLGLGVGRVAQTERSGLMQVVIR